MEKYKIVKNSDSYRLAEIVNSFILKGYEPLGGVSASFDADTRSYTLFQAMIKRSGEE